LIDTSGTTEDGTAFVGIIKHCWTSLDKTAVAHSDARWLAMIGDQGEVNNAPQNENNSSFFA
jgi:hypothetical protein